MKTRVEVLQERVSLVSLEITVGLSWDDKRLFTIARNNIVVFSDIGIRNAEVFLAGYEAGLPESTEETA